MTVNLTKLNLFIVTIIEWLELKPVREKNLSNYTQTTEIDKNTPTFDKKKMDYTFASRKNDSTPIGSIIISSVYCTTIVY